MAAMSIGRKALPTSVTRASLMKGRLPMRSRQPTINTPAANTATASAAMMRMRLLGVADTDVGSEKLFAQALQGAVRLQFLQRGVNRRNRRFVFLGDDETARLPLRARRCQATFSPESGVRFR